MPNGPETATVDPSQLLMQLAFGYAPSAAIYVTAKLEIADRLAAGPKPVTELAAETGTNADALYRVLRLLVSMGIFQEVGEKRIANNAVSEVMRKDAQPSLHAMLVFGPDPVHFRIYAEMMESVKTGRPASEKTLGMPIFEYMTRNPEYSEIFNNAMTTFSAAVVPAVLEAYDFSGIGTLVDIAGGHGHMLMSVLEKYPKMRGILADVDHVIAGAVPKVAARSLADRCGTVAVDFFKSVPSGGDAYIMKHIIHDWDDDQALTILRNVHQAMGSGRGTLLLLEMIIPDDSRLDMGKAIDLEMLVFPGGRERTATEFRALFDRAGFDLTRIVPTKSPVAVIEGRKRP